MSSKIANGIQIPHWYLRTFETVRNLHHGLHRAELELREAMELDPLDASVRAELQGVMESLRTIRTRLSVLGMTATDVLRRTPGQAA
jgi:hypothetical protein